MKRAAKPHFFWSRLSIAEASDLESWRAWLTRAILFFAMVGFPLAMVFSVPHFMREQHHELIVVDTLVFCLIVFGYFIHPKTYRLRYHVWMFLLYILTISFFLNLGPNYARSAWLIMIVVMSSVLYGTKAAAVTTCINAALLFFIYLIADPNNPEWTRTFRGPFSQWVMFVVNTSVIGVACGVPVGFLLNKLSLSLEEKKDALKELNHNNQALQEAYASLQREVDGRKEVEKALEDSESKFRDLVENVNEVIYSMDRDGRITYVNPAVERVLGYTPPEVTGRHFADFVHKDDLERQKARFRVLLSGPIGGDEYRLVGRSGDIRWVRSSTRPIYREGEPVFLEGVLFDITERKQAEDALVEANQRYQALFDSKTNLVFLMDDQGRFIDANASALRLFGYAMEEIQGLTIATLLHPDQDVDPVARVMGELFETGDQAEPLELKLKTKHGDAVHIETGGTAIVGTREIIGVARDITRQKQAEEAKQALESQLLQAQKLEAIGTLTGGIAHDFNNSLQGILGYTQMLMMDLPPGSPLATRLVQVESSALKASELTRRLLTFSRRVESRLRPLDLNQAVRQIGGMARRTIPRMIRIELQLDEDLRTINADAAQIEQVLVNLMINARDAMPEGGTLKIETRNETLDASGCPLHPGAPPGEYIAIVVSDSGLGMDPRTIEHIFEPFYTTKEPGKGTGLGLSMVYGVVRNHGGHIACRSEPGRGSRFHILLPALTEKPVLLTEERPAEARKGGSETILLVEDDASIREQACEILSRFGYRVFPAEDGRRALDIYWEKKDSISLIVLDVIMPGMSGRECLEEIVRIDPRQKVMMVSGDAFSATLMETLETCSGGTLKKPYTLDQLLDKVRSVLDS